MPVLGVEDICGPATSTKSMCFKSISVLQHASSHRKHVLVCRQLTVPWLRSSSLSQMTSACLHQTPRHSSCRFQLLVYLLKL